MKKREKNIRGHITENIISGIGSICLQQQKLKNQRHVAKVGAWLSEYKKSLSCNRCSETHPATLQFHHLNPEEKEFSIGMYRQGKYSRKRLMAEIEKCEVICANCHAKEHWGHIYE